MSNSTLTYVPKLEVLHSLMKGIALSIAIIVLANILLGILDGEISRNVNTSVKTSGVINTLGYSLFGLFAAIISFGFWYAFMLMFSMPQYFLLVLPLLKIYSSSLKSDADRSWGFYVVAGFLIGGMPWFSLAYYWFGNSIDFDDIMMLFVWPAFLVGAISGTVLKYRLVHLAAEADIPIGID